MGKTLGGKRTLEGMTGQLPKIGAGWSPAVLNIASALRYDERFFGGGGCGFGGAGVGGIIPAVFKVKNEIPLKEPYL